MKNNWLKNGAKYLEYTYSNIDALFSGIKIYDLGKRTGKSINKTIDIIIDFIVPVNKQSKD